MLTVTVKKFESFGPCWLGGCRADLPPQEELNAALTRNTTERGINHERICDTKRCGCKRACRTKNRLTYLSWAWAWAELKKRYPNSFYTIYENATGWFYHTDGKTCWVKTGVTLVDGEYQLEHIEYLPVMDFKNASIPVDKVTSFEVNKAIQRSLTKAVARHGLGLYIYAGEDLPEGSDNPPTPIQEPGELKPPPQAASNASALSPAHDC